MKTTLRIAAMTALGIGFLLQPVTARAAAEFSVTCQDAWYNPPARLEVGIPTLNGQSGWIEYTPIFVYQDARGYKVGEASNAWFLTHDAPTLVKPINYRWTGSWTYIPLSVDTPLYSFSTSQHTGPVWVLFKYWTYTSGHWAGPFYSLIGGGSCVLG